MRSIENSLTFQSVDKIKSICSPLFANKIKHFTHDITFSNGQLSELTSNPSVYELWSSKRPSAVFVNESGRILKSGIYLSEVLEEQDEYYKNSKHLFFTVVGCNKMLEIVEREDDCQHMFHLGLNYNGADYHQWLLNNIDIFKKFINYYKKAAKELILEIKKVENRLILPVRQQCGLQNIPDIAAVNTIDSKKEKYTMTLNHHQTFELITIAKQQSLCLAHLMLGKTAKDIATQMGISFRTVEHYLETIKKRLGCGSSMELISKYSDQISLLDYPYFK